MSSNAHSSLPVKIASNCQNISHDSRRRTHQLEKTSPRRNDKERKASEIINSYEDRLRVVNQEVKAIRSRAETEANELLDDVKRKVEALVKEIRESGAAPEVVRKVRQEITAIKKSHPVPAEKDEKRSIQRIEPGMLVKIRGTEMAGEVIELVDAKKVVLESGGKRVIVSIDSLETTREKPLVFMKQNDFIDFSEASNEVDLRGLYGDESIEILDKFIDKAILLRLTRFESSTVRGAVRSGKGSTSTFRKIRTSPHFNSGNGTREERRVTVAVLNE